MNTQNTRGWTQKSIVRFTIFTFALGIISLIVQGRRPQQDLAIVPDSSWTPAEAQQINKIVNDVYPRLVNWYGRPSERGTLTLHKVSGATSTNTQEFHLDMQGVMHVEANHTITISSEVMEYPSILVHELAHFFHGRRQLFYYAPPRKLPNGVQIFRHEGLEEGMAQAAALRIGAELGYPKTKTEVFEIEPSGFNKPELGFVSIFTSDTFGLKALYPIRVNVAAAAVLWWEANHPGFVKRFNEALYALPESRLPLSIQGDCVDIGEQITPGFASWFKDQAIFNPTARRGPAICVIGDNDGVGVILFNRTDLKETPLVDQKVTVILKSRVLQLTKTYSTNEDGIVIMRFSKKEGHYHAEVRWGELSDTFDWESVYDKFGG